MNNIFGVSHVHVKRMAEIDKGARVKSGLQFSYFDFVGLG